MTKNLPAFAKATPTAMGSAPIGAKCECCSGTKNVWSYFYGKKVHDICTACSTLCGSGTRWKYAGGGSIEVIARR